MKYHVKWIQPNFFDHELKLGKEVVEELYLGAFIVGLINDSCVVIQCEPVA